MDSVDRLAEQAGDAQHHQPVLDGVGTIADGDGVGDGQFGEGTILQALHGGRGEDGVGGGDVNVASAVLADDFDRFADGAGGGDHVIDHQDVFAFDVADDVHGLGFGDAFAALVDDADFAAENLGVHLGALDIAHVGRDEDGVGQIDLEAAHPAGEDGDGVEVIDGNVEESLHLGGVKVDGDDAIGAGALEQVGE